LSWAQTAAPYSGAFVEYYRAGVDLLAEIQQAYDQSSRTAQRATRSSSILNGAAVVLAAVAGITALPDVIARWVSAVVAFGAAVVSGINSSFKPEQVRQRAMVKSVRWIQLRDHVENYLRWVIRLPKDASIEEIENRLSELQGIRDSVNAGAGETGAEQT
jgi:hypothetical protein